MKTSWPNTPHTTPVASIDRLWAFASTPTLNDGQRALLIYKALHDAVDAPGEYAANALSILLGRTDGQQTQHKPPVPH